MKRRGLFFIVGLLFRASSAMSQETPAQAKELFERYVALDQAFDPKIASLYADEAKIQIMRNLPDGEKRTITIPVPDYRKQIQVAMPLAKITGEIATYENVKYAQEGERVRITCTRISGGRSGSSPLSLLVGPGTDGHWLIFEELAES